VASDEADGASRPAVRVLAVLGIIAFLAGFVWVWWAGVPVLYRGINDISPLTG
jgi:hypothetical protein